MQEWKEKDVLIFFLPTFSPELNLIEILWRRIKYNWIPLDAYLCFQNLKECLSFVLNNFGTTTLYFDHYLVCPIVRVTGIYFWLTFNVPLKISIVSIDG